jgi:hypothetical protein
MNAKMIAIVGSIAGLGLLGLGTQSAKAAGITFSVSVPAPVFCPPVVVRQAPQVIYYQQPVQQVVYQQAPQVVYQQAPQVIYEQAPQVVYQTQCAAPVIYAPAPIFFRSDVRFDHPDFRGDGRGRADVRIGGRR